jgi:Na+-transporting methylmalonyl-CoA/oxaloacetate decarboxylase beta subunit
VNAGGDVVKEDPVAYAFIWIGIMAGIGLILAGILAFVFAAPAGVLITRFINRNKKQNMAENIEPK